MVYGRQITIVTGAYKPTYNWGAHIVYIYMMIGYKQLTNWLTQLL